MQRDREGAVPPATDPAGDDTISDRDLITQSPLSRQGAGGQHEISPRDLPQFLGYVRSAPRALDRPVASDAFGFFPVFHTRKDGVTYVGRSVRELARLHDRVTVNLLAVAEQVGIEIIFRDETLLREVKLVPPGATLLPDGKISSAPPLRKGSSIRTLDAAVDALRSTMADLIAEAESTWDLHLGSLSSGRDSRILAVHPKLRPEAWHWITVSGPESGERAGAVHFASFLRLPHFRAYPVSPERTFAPAEIAAGVERTNGLLRIFETGIFRCAFEDYHESLREGGAEVPGPERTAVWTGALGDALLGPTMLYEGTGTLWEAIRSPPDRHLSLVLTREMADLLASQRELYHSNPFPIECEGKRDLNYLLRLLTRGRRYVCTALPLMYSRISENVVHPYLHPAMLDVILEIDSDFFANDSLRTVWLERMAPGSSIPNRSGMGIPDYWPLLEEAVRIEAARSPLAPRILHRSILSRILDGRPPRRLPLAPRRVLDRGRRLARSIVGTIRRADRLAEAIYPDLAAQASLRFYERVVSVLAWFHGLESSGIRIEW